MKKEIIYNRLISTLILFVCFFVTEGKAQTLRDSLPKKHLVVFPVLARSIETDWSFGLANSSTFKMSRKDSTSRTSNLQVIALYTLKKQFVTAINGVQYAHQEKYILNEQLSYSSFPDKIWGLGNHSSDSALENYSFKQYYVYLHFMHHLGKKLYLGSIVELQNLLEVNHLKNGVFDKQQIIGRNPYFIAGMGLSITYDSRNDAFAPNKGYFAQGYFNHFNQAIGSSFNYTNWLFDFRTYFKGFDKDVIATQLFSFNNAGNVPLRSLATFGGNNSMRGFYDGRYRDKCQLVIQSEYRIPIYRRWGVVVFGGTGDVSDEWYKYSTENLKYAYGGGIRFALNKSEKLNLRMDYGFGGKNNSGLYFQLGEAF